MAQSLAERIRERLGRSARTARNPFGRPPAGPSIGGGRSSFNLPGRTTSAGDLTFGSKLSAKFDTFRQPSGFSFTGPKKKRKNRNLFKQILPTTEIEKVRLLSKKEQKRRKMDQLKGLRESAQRSKNFSQSEIALQKREFAQKMDEVLRRQFGILGIRGGAPLGASERFLGNRKLEGKGFLSALEIQPTAERLKENFLALQKQDIERDHGLAGITDPVTAEEDKFGSIADPDRDISTDAKKEAKKRGEKRVADFTAKSNREKKEEFNSRTGLLSPPTLKAERIGDRRIQRKTSTSTDPVIAKLQNRLFDDERAPGPTGTDRGKIQRQIDARFETLFRGSKEFRAHKFDVDQFTQSDIEGRPEEAKGFATGADGLNVDLGAGGRGQSTTGTALADILGPGTELGIQPLSAGSFLRDADGKFTDEGTQLIADVISGRIDPDIVESLSKDPVQETFEILQRQQQQTLEQAAGPINKQIQRIKETGRFISGPKAGQLTEQAKRQIAELTRQKQKLTDDINFEFDREKDKKAGAINQALIEDRNETMQLLMEHAQGLASDPKKIMAAIKEKELFEGATKIFEEGRASSFTQAEAIWKEQQKHDQGDPTKKQIGDTFQEFVEQGALDGTITERGVAEKALDLHNGDMGEAIKLIKSRGVLSTKEIRENIAEVVAERNPFMSKEAIAKELMVDIPINEMVMSAIEGEPVNIKSMRSAFDELSFTNKTKLKNSAQAIVDSDRSSDDAKLLAQEYLTVAAIDDDHRDLDETSRRAMKMLLDGEIDYEFEFLEDLYEGAEFMTKGDKRYINNLYLRNIARGNPEATEIANTSTIAVERDTQSTDEEMKGFFSEIYDSLKGLVFSDDPDQPGVDVDSEIDDLK